MGSLSDAIAIRPRIRKFLDSYFRGDQGINIRFNLRIRALNASCEYIEKNMVGVPMFDKANEALNFAVQEVNIEGLFCEFGVYKGKSVNYIANLIEQDIHAFDSFEGLPEQWLDSHKKGHFTLNDLPEFEDNVVVHKGWFDVTLPLFIERFDEDVAFLHVDCDLYSSTNTVLSLLTKRIVPGTVIMFDEYFNYPFWEHHEYKAFQEFVKSNDILYEYLCYSSNCVAVRILDNTA